MLGLGFIGLGNVARHHMRIFRSVRGCRIHAGADPVEGARKASTDLHPQLRAYADYRELLTDPRVEAVLVATPTKEHRRPAIDALRAGKPVMVEKPMARTVADCRRMIDVARECGTLLMVAHCRRYDPGWAAWAKPALAGRLGRPLLWRDVSASRHGGWFMDDRIGGGPMLDAAVHNYDYANMLWGDPQSVVASSIELDPDTSAVDTATAVVRYSAGDQLMLSWSWASRGSHSFDLLGPLGAIMDGAGPLAPPSSAQRDRRFYHLIDRADRARLLSAPADAMEMYRRQARHFLACVAGKEQCRSPGEEAIKAVAVAEAILAAGRRGGSRQVRW